MNIDFKKLNINTKDDFINYFMYYYEYTFLLDELDSIDCKKEITKIVETSNITDLNKLWIYTYIKFTLLISKNYPIDFLKNSMEKIIKNYDNLEEKVLTIQLELMKDILHDLGVLTLEMRPYEQLKMQSSYGTFLRTKEKFLINFFETNIDKFSITNANKVRYIKIKNSKYIDFPTSLFEFYSVTLFEMVEDIADSDDIDIDEIVEEKIEEFLSVFKKGKFPKKLQDELICISINLINEYIDFSIDYILSNKKN